MPAYKDDQAGSWYVQFYYTDYTGARKKKKKRGFPTKREATAWEREFLTNQTAAPTITLNALSELYFEDMAHRLRRSSIENKRWTVEHKVLPYFGKLPLCEITPAAVRKWQSEMMGAGYSGTYLRMMNTQFSALMNYAVRYYGLEKNPCRIAGTMGTGQAEEMQFWTREEFSLFIDQVEKVPAHVGFLVLYYTGLRIGEMLALTPADIDLEKKTLSVTKSLRLIGQEAVITPPKTSRSIRTIDIPSFLCQAIAEYEGRLYGLATSDRLFPQSRSYFTKELKRGTDRAGVKRIRLHDLRHSHASLLIEKGTPPLLVAERLGHDSIETTLNTYSHLFPSRRDQLNGILEGLEPK